MTGKPNVNKTSLTIGTHDKRFLQYCINVSWSYVKKDNEYA